MTLLDLIKQDTPEILSSSIARLTGLTFTGAFLLNLVFLALFWMNMRDAITGGSTLMPPETLFQNLAIYFGICFIFCFVSSISFTPKRMVSPLHVQITTCGGIIIQLIIAFQGQFSNSTTFVINSITPLSIYVMIFITFGWMMEKGLRVLIGLSGTEKDLVKYTFRVNVKYQDVRSILKNSDFCKDHDFRIMENNDEKIILRTRAYEDIKIVVVGIPFIQEQTIISIVAHGLNYDSLINSRRARKKTSSLTRDIQDELKDLESNLKPEDHIEDNEAEATAKNIAMKTTRTVLKSAPHRLFVTFAILVGIGLWLIQPLNEQKITPDTYLAVWLTIITTIVILVVPTVRERRRAT